MIVLFTVYDGLTAQEMTGITSSKYGGIHNALLNPSLPVLSPWYLDVNLATANASIENNYIYIRPDEDKFKRIFGSGYLSADGPSLADDPFYFDYYTPTLKNGQINARVMGPSAAMMLGRHALAITTGVRSVTSVRNIPMPLAKFLYEGMYFPAQHNIRYRHTEKMSIANLDWAELGFNYSYVVQNRNRNVWAAGITLKRLAGYAGAYVYADHLDYMISGRDTLTVYRADIEAGMSLPVDYDDNSFMGSDLIRGKGVGLDVGVTYEKKIQSSTRMSYFRRPCAQRYTPYIYRIGISLMDVGRIHFTNHAQKYTVDHGSLYWPAFGKISYTNINDLLSETGDHASADPLHRATDDEFTMNLPATLNLHGDYNFNGHWYAGAIVVLPVWMTPSSVILPGQMTGGIRYETLNYGVGATVSLYNGEHFHLGFNGRFRNFFIGTSNIISFLKLTNYTGTDLYAGIKISLHKGRCKLQTFNCPDVF